MQSLCCNMPKQFKINYCKVIFLFPMIFRASETVWHTFWKAGYFLNTLRWTLRAFVFTEQPLMYKITRYVKKRFIFRLEIATKRDKIIFSSFLHQFKCFGIKFSSLFKSVDQKLKTSRFHRSFSWWFQG